MSLKMSLNDGSPSLTLKSKIGTFVTDATKVPFSFVTKVSFSFHTDLVKGERGFCRKCNFSLLFYEGTVSDGDDEEHALADVEASFDRHQRAFVLRITEDIEKVFRAGKAKMAGKNAF